MCVEYFWMNLTGRIDTTAYSADTRLETKNVIVRPTSSKQLGPKEQMPRSNKSRAPHRRLGIYGVVDRDVRRKTRQRES